MYGRKSAILSRHGGEFMPGIGMHVTIMDNNQRMPRCNRLTMPGIYTFNSAESLFEKLKKSFANFCDNPSVEGVYDVIFPLYHLREWIYPNGHEAYKNKKLAQMSREELLHKSLHEMGEYKIVRELCNNAKHFDASDIDDHTDVLEGARAGLMRAGDNLGVTHFLVDDTEIRDIFWPVYNVYLEYFEQT